MLICGVKVTHDGGVALVDGTRLVFSTEVEKLNNNRRYSELGDAAIIADILGHQGYTLDDVDTFVVDGWGAIGAPGPETHELYIPETRVTLADGGQDHILRVARYRESPLRDDITKLRPFSGLHIRGRSYSYVSSLHVTGHILGAYCASPFAERNEDAYVLVWDGGIFPTLYYVNSKRREVEGLGVLFRISGNAYGMFARHFPPFRDADEHGLATAGKVMAFIATGQVRNPILRALKVTTKDINDGHYDLPKRLARSVESQLSSRDFTPADYMATFHQFLQDLLCVTLAQKLMAEPQRRRNLCIAGGCGLNIKWNTAVREIGILDEVFVPPFPNDAGSAIGAACTAMFVHGPRPNLDWSVYSGPSLVDELPGAGWESRACTIKELADLLHETQAPVVFLNGRAEIGPRALGARSILASAQSPIMTATLNRAKGRETYRPVSPICLEERASEIFEPGSPDPYMLFEHRVRPAWREKIPAVIHLDGTSRLQTVNAQENADLAELLGAYTRLSGVPVLCNTSANGPGRGFFPSVRSATDWGQVDYVWSNNMLHFHAQRLSGGGSPI